jgi:ubiquinone/menaquinone biosynthesis C-methylase UbiE
MIMTETGPGEVRAFIHGMWASVAAAWDANADDVDRRSAAITERMLDSVDLRPGDRVLELACGPGGAGLAAAVRVGADSEVVISDVVPAMAEIAGRRAKERGLSNIRTEVLDLENIDVPDAAFDVVLCREGMMFALAPGQAAGEIHRVLRPAGRVAVAVWASREENPWLGLLLDAITETTGIVVPPPGVPGPFALSDGDMLRRLFADAGFAEIAVNRVDTALRSPSFDAWWTRNLTVAGPVVNILNRLDDDTRDRLQATVRAAVAPCGRNGALQLPGVALVLAARRP